MRDSLCFGSAEQPEVRYVKDIVINGVTKHVFIDSLKNYYRTPSSKVVFEKNGEYVWGYDFDMDMIIDNDVAQGMKRTITPQCTYFQLSPLPGERQPSQYHVDTTKMLQQFCGRHSTSITAEFGFVENMNVTTFYGPEPFAACICIIVDGQCVATVCAYPFEEPTLPYVTNTGCTFDCTEHGSGLRTCETTSESTCRTEVKEVHEEGWMVTERGTRTPARKWQWDPKTGRVRYVPDVEELPIIEIHSDTAPEWRKQGLNSLGRCLAIIAFKGQFDTVLSLPINPVSAYVLNKQFNVVVAYASHLKWKKVSKRIGQRLNLLPTEGSKLAGKIRSKIPKEAEKPAEKPDVIIFDSQDLSDLKIGAKLNLYDSIQVDNTWYAACEKVIVPERDVPTTFKDWETFMEDRRCRIYISVDDNLSKAKKLAEQYLNSITVPGDHAPPRFT